MHDNLYMSKSAGDHRSNAQKSVISGTPETRSVSQWTGGTKRDSSLGGIAFPPACQREGYPFVHSLLCKWEEYPILHVRFAHPCRLLSTPKYHLIDMWFTK